MVTASQVIGVTVGHGTQEWIDNYAKNYRAVVTERPAHFVVLSPDCPTVLPNGISVMPNTNGELPDDILDDLDGLILSGGGDVHPSRFGQEMDGAESDRISSERDALELTLTKAAMVRDMPVFGICRGFQVLNVAAGGGLIQHFDGHRSPEDHTLFHNVLLSEDSLMHKATRPARLLSTLSTIKGEHRTSSGWSGRHGIAQPDSWLVEAIESPTHTWVVGVQWHPERTFELRNRIFIYGRATSPHVRSEKRAADSENELFDYHLPPGMIAQNPVVPSDTSRLMVLDRGTGSISHRHFYDIGEYLDPGDLLVANNSRVIPPA